MKIYTFYTDSHTESLYLLKKSLERLSLENDLYVEKYEQECESGDFMSSGWNLTMKKKVNFILETIEKGECFIHCDSDVVFLENPYSSLITELGDFDVAFQSDSLDGSWYCMGFFVCKPSSLTKILFTKIYENMHLYQNDQHALREILLSHQRQPIAELEGLKYKTLSSKFFTYGLLDRGRWDGHEFDIPNDVITFHANWTVGVQNKIKLTNYILEKLNILF